MPLYQQVLVTLPKTAKTELTELFRRYARVVVDNGGVMRGVENQGVRTLPERMKRKYRGQDGERYFWDARYVTTTFDVSPKALVEVDRFLRNESLILRQFTLRLPNAQERVNGETYKNPYL